MALSVGPVILTPARERRRIWLGSPVRIPDKFAVRLAHTETVGAYKVSQCQPGRTRKFEIPRDHRLQCRSEAAPGAVTRGGFRTFGYRPAGIYDTLKRD